MSLISVSHAKGGGRVEGWRKRNGKRNSTLSGVNKIVILDEATSSLTHSMETRISRALSEHFRSSTVITITHRVRCQNQRKVKFCTTQSCSIDRSVSIGFRRFPSAGTSGARHGQGPRARSRASQGVRLARQTRRRQVIHSSYAPPRDISNWGFQLGTHFPPLAAWF